MKQAPGSKPDRTVPCELLFAALIASLAGFGCDGTRRIVGPDGGAPPTPPLTDNRQASPSNDFGPPSSDLHTPYDPTNDGGLASDANGPKCGCPADQLCVIYAIANGPDYGGEDFRLFHECVALPASCGPNACLTCADQVCGSLTTDGGMIPHCRRFKADDPWWCKGGLYEPSRCDGHYSCQTE